MTKKNFIILLILVFVVFSLIGISTALNRSGKLIITPANCGSSDKERILPAYIPYDDTLRLYGSDNIEQYPASTPSRGGQ